jgi:hypothetical protein
MFSVSTSAQFVDCANPKIASDIIADVPIRTHAYHDESSMRGDKTDVRVCLLLHFMIVNFYISL